VHIFGNTSMPLFLLHREAGVERVGHKQRKRVVRHRGWYIVCDMTSRDRRTSTSHYIPVQYGQLVIVIEQTGNEQP
jgi:hypothetical protein